MSNNSRESEIGKYSILGGGFNVTYDPRDQVETREDPQTIFEEGNMIDAVREFANTSLNSFSGIYTPNNYRIRFERRNDFGFEKQFTRRMDFFAAGVNLPGKNIESSPLKIYGPEREMPNGVSYSGDITIRFIAEQDFYLYRWFIQWMNSIVGETTSNVSYYDDYVGRMYIAPTIRGQDNTRDESPIVFVVEDVWPKTMSAMELSNSSRSSLLEYTVNLSFRKWHYIALDKQIVPPPPPPITDEEANAAYDEYLANTSSFLRANELAARREYDREVLGGDILSRLNPRQDQQVVFGEERFTNGNLPTPILDLTRGIGANAQPPEELTDLERLLQ